MYAAAVTEFDRAPRYTTFAEPEARDGNEIVDVLAAGLHPRVRSQANGSHYTSTTALPLIPGIDGVGQRADGSLVYFVLPDTQFGSMAERVAIDVRRSLPVPHGSVAAIAIAAAMNPAMSSWVGLRRRAVITPGQSALVLGATGSAGQLAIQVAKHLGASHVVAAGRDSAAVEYLPALGADAVVSLEGDPADAAARVGEAASEVDIVIDYLWGEPAQLTIPALLRARSDRGVRLTWVQVGAITGPEILLPSATLRAANLSLMGSGQGSVSTQDILEELVPLMAEVARGTFVIDTDVRQLNDVESVWVEPARARRRIVFTP